MIRLCLTNFLTLKSSGIPSIITFKKFLKSHAITSSSKQSLSLLKKEIIVLYKVTFTCNKQI